MLSKPAILPRASSPKGSYLLSDKVVDLLPPSTIRLGDHASLTKTISDHDVRQFADLSLDYNPVHLNDTFAEHSRFGRRIVHGALAAGLVSAVLGTRLPGPGSIYVSQTFQYKAPIYIGDTITATVTVTKVRPERRLFVLQTDVQTQTGTIVLTGEAVIILDRADVMIIADAA